MLNSLQKKRNDQSGFTIIEVLIVLAIAGLILLVVFLAVPALQRNAHNTTKKSDVASVLGAMTEYVSNNGGSLPIAQTGIGSGNNGNIGKVGAAGINVANVKLGNYDAGSVNISVTVPAKPAVDVLYIVEKATCDPLSPNVPTLKGATARSFAAYFTLEGGAEQCSSS